MINIKRIIVLLLCLTASQSSFADFPRPWQMNFQEAASPIMAKLDWFHDFLLLITSSIVVFVFLLLAFVCYKFSAKRNPVPATFTHNVAIEIIWTVIPIIILVIIAIPSLQILKFEEEAPSPDMTIKVVGSQWYWTYSYPDHGNFEFDSYMIKDKDLKPGQLRLLEVDNRIIVPEGAVIKFLVTGADVVHSFSIPALGIKIDAVPGKVTHAWTKIDKKGVYYGQCSELCGVQHGFMPIAIEVVSKEDFEAWVATKNPKTASIYDAKLLVAN